MDVHCKAAFAFNEDSLIGIAASVSGKSVLAAMQIDLLDAAFRQHVWTASLSQRYGYAATELLKT
jgi:hypothetical protein